MKPAVKSYWTDDLPARWIIDTREGYWLIDGFVTSFCWLTYGLSHWTASTFEKRGTKIQYILLVVSLFCDWLSRVWKDQNKDFISSHIRYCVHKCLQRTPWGRLPPPPLRRKGIEPSWRHQCLTWHIWLSRPCHWLCAQLKSALALWFMPVPVSAHCSHRRARSLYSFSFASHLLGTRCEWKSILVLRFFWHWLPKVCVA